MKLCINGAFSDKAADLSKMADIRNKSENLYISEALHKADIKFTEKGIITAAVIVLIGKAKALPIQQPPKFPNEVKIDR